MVETPQLHRDKRCAEQSEAGDTPAVGSLWSIIAARQANIAVEVLQLTGLSDQGSYNNKLGFFFEQ